MMNDGNMSSALFLDDMRMRARTREGVKLWRRQICSHEIQQGLANCGPRVKSCSPVAFINYILLERGHAHPFTYCLWCHAREFRSCNRGHMACKAKTTIWPFTEGSLKTACKMALLPCECSSATSDRMFP